MLDPAWRKVMALVEGFFWLLPNIGLALVTFLLFLAGAWAAQRAVAAVGRRRERGDLGVLLGTSVKWAIIVLGLLVAATILFPSVKPGDQIRTGDVEGTVEHIEARATLIRTYDGQRVVVPNSEVYTRTVTVRTAFPLRRSEYDVGIGYGDDAERACAVILDSLRALEGVAQDPEPEALPWALDGSSVNIRVQWWSAPDQASLVRARAGHNVREAGFGAGRHRPAFPHPRHPLSRPDRVVRRRPHPPARGLAGGRVPASAAAPELGEQHPVLRSTRATALVRRTTRPAMPDEGAALRPPGPTFVPGSWVD